jgi:hypothetical protein
VCSSHSFVVTTPSFAYVFDGGSANPTLTLCRGVTYTFDMDAVNMIHPMDFRNGTTLLHAFTPGDSSTYSYTVPATGTLPDNYNCRIHNFGGSISITN